MKLIAALTAASACVWNVKLHSMLSLLYKMTVAVAQSSLGVSDEQT
jgi:hypothetical protein